MYTYSPHVCDDALIHTDFQERMKELKEEVYIYAVLLQLPNSQSSVLIELTMSQTFNINECL